MKLFECQRCGQMLYFENTECERCGSSLGFLSDEMQLSALSPEQGCFHPMIDPGREMRYCANAAYDACNWMVPADAANPYCMACRLNRTVPDLGNAASVLLWRQIETAKHRLVYGLLRMGLPVISRFDDGARGFAFDFLSGPSAPGRAVSPVTTGHNSGLITIDVAEADDAVRARNRRDMGEPYRTLLGHFRHEIGHYYWDRLVRDTVWHASFREMFGDERANYGEALSAYYANGAPAGWQDSHVSAYATAHAWEDFAETWAHYLHIADTLETAGALGLRTRPQVSEGQETDFRSGDPDDFDALMAAWIPLTVAVNNLNQSMGQDDLYPFVLSPTVMGKIRFIHGLVQGARRAAAPAAPQ
ncbi:MAG: putative zinc-binding peptidase [Parvibaculum sp.]|uniref:zinc-binding metallopeptidase family protein n=1 Tax=Parvibaculum sp. TaxID=2024848 RepID=UPI001B21CA4B|nr:putative zinc-binding peptidase [Parvibaculum sp.]MBO6634392.1 putative zinc-binding peptidase [Parvibaculum sp.]